jgi:hypothetical protein
VRCTGDANFSGVFTLTFNGETTNPLSVLGISELDVVDALQTLRTVGDVGASVAATPSEEEPTLDVTVEFARSTSLEPFNWGELPLLVVNTSRMVGLVDGTCSVERISNFVYEVSRGR